MTIPVCTKFSDRSYCEFCYDMMTSLTENYENTRVIVNIGLTNVEGGTCGLGVRGKGDSDLLKLTENCQMVRRLCDSQKHHTFLISSHIQATRKIILVQNLLKNGFLYLNGRNGIVIVKIFLLNIKNKPRNHLSNIMVVYFCKFRRKLPSSF